MYSVDKTNFISFLQQFPNQIIESKKLVENSEMKIDSEKIENIIYLGMGGSAIAGDVIRESLFDDLTLPLNVYRGYDVPEYCNENSLIIVCSFSGNTEETLNSIGKAHKRGAQIVAVTSGGKLGDLAKKNNWTLVEVPGGLPPRQAFGYLFFSVLRVLSFLGYCTVQEKEINNIIKISNGIVRQNSEKTATGRILSKELARQVQNNIPIIYSTAPYFGAVAMRWKTQFQENSKSMAFYNVIPEMNHNEIVGWEMEHKMMNQFIVIFLQSKNINPRIAARISLTKNIIRDRGAKIAEIFAEGITPLEQAISFVLMGDWITYYLALFYNRNPLSILNIDYLKNELKKVE